MNPRASWAENKLHYRFKNPALLDMALTHRSASRDNNERLEFLGDAFLSFAIARRLYERRPNDTEGDLSRARAALVKKPTLAAIGQDLGIDSIIILGPGELRSGGARRGAVLADAVEALIGAVLLDGGPEAADELVGRLFADRIDELPESDVLKDSKTQLQEWLQARGWQLPTYRVDLVAGLDHQRVFTVVCEVKERSLQTKGRGPSRRRAEQQAAAAMLSLLTGEHT
ncbi:MAG TPA: ribonuclease III [Gammaproteobacteria bacterium]